MENKKSSKNAISDVKPWENEPDKKKFTYKGYKCEIIRNAISILCGYVNIPVDNEKGKSLLKIKKKLNQYVFNNIHIDYIGELDKYFTIHGGVTYFEEKISNGKEYVSIGFDCGHVNDLIPNLGGTPEIFKSMGVPKRLIDQFKEKYSQKQNETYKDIPFVEKELKGLVDQIIKYDGKE